MKGYSLIFLGFLGMSLGFSQDVDKSVGESKTSPKNDIQVEKNSINKTDVSPRFSQKKKEMELRSESRSSTAKNKTLTREELLHKEQVLQSKSSVNNEGRKEKKKD